MEDAILESTLRWRPSDAAQCSACSAASLAFGIVRGDPARRLASLPAGRAFALLAGPGTVTSCFPFRAVRVLLPGRNRRSQSAIVRLPKGMGPCRLDTMTGPLPCFLAKRIEGRSSRYRLRKRRQQKRPLGVFQVDSQTHMPPVQNLGDNAYR